MPPRARGMAGYYDDNALRYFEATVGVDMAVLRERFLAHLPAHSHVLDAGCGSGRDARAFLEAGYRVTAMDASARLAELASRHIGQPVKVRRFQEVDWTDTFDGVWACASLLHVPRTELPAVLHRLARALKPGGILYASFKYGAGERDSEGRQFTDLDEPALAEILSAVPELHCRESWVSGDRRAQRAHERWLNALLVRG